MYAELRSMYTLYTAEVAGYYSAVVSAVSASMSHFTKLRTGFALPVLGL